MAISLLNASNKLAQLEALIIIALSGLSQLKKLGQLRPKQSVLLCLISAENTGVLPIVQQATYSALSMAKHTQQ